MNVREKNNKGLCKIEIEFPEIFQKEEIKKIYNFEMFLSKFG